MNTPSAVAVASVGATLNLFGLSERSTARIVRALTLPNPTWLRATRMNRYVPPDEPQNLEFAVEMPDGWLHVPRGAVQIVKDCLKEDGLTMSVMRDLRTTGMPFIRSPRALEIYKSYEFREFQRAGIEVFKKNLQGTIVLPCQTGKTKLAVGAIIEIGRKAIVVVPTTDIATQWAKDAKTFGLSVGILGGGSADTLADVVVAVVDSLESWAKSDPDFIQTFGIVIVDEAHRTPCRTIQSCLRLLPAKWRLGLTATPFREDGLTDLIDWSFGPRLLERSTEEMIRAGFLMPCEFETVETDFTFEHDGHPDKKMAALDLALAEDMVRNAMIADRAAEEVRNGETVLVLANRKDMVKELTEMINARLVPCVGLTSLSGKSLRGTVLECLKLGSFRCAVGTALADEGISIPRLSRILLAFPQRAKGPTMQRIGRVLGVYDKKPKIIDFVDPHVPTLVRRAAERARIFASINVK